MIKRRDIIVNFVTSLLLVIFAVYYTSSTMFAHTHEIDGATITHSHIYGASHADLPDGGHSEQSLTLISHLSSFVALGIDTFDVDLSPIEVECCVAYVESVQWVDGDIFYLSTPRAPPVL